MNKKTLFKAGAYLCYLVVLLELLSRFVYWMPQLSARLWADEDNSWRRTWVKRHQQTNIPVYHSFDEYDPSKGWATRPNIRNMTVFGNKTLNTGPDGFRMTRELSAKKTAKGRILVLGDSFTFGDEVSDRETYPYYLQQMLPDWEIINGGVHGYGHDQMLILLKEAGPRLKPDLVVIGFMPWDSIRNVLFFRDFAKPRYILVDNHLKLAGTPVPPPDDILRWYWIRPRFLDIIAYLAHKIKISTGSYDQEVANVTTAILSEMIRTTHELQAIPILVYLPSPERFRDPASATPAERYMFSLCDAHENVRCISTRPYFSGKITRGTVFREEGHYDPAGNLTVAEAIRDHLLMAPSPRAAARRN